MVPIYKLLNYKESKTKETKRIEIINASRDLFIRDSIYKVTMKQIAEKVDISIRSLYYYYKSKDDLAIDIQIMDMYKVFNDISNIELNEKTGYESVVKYLNNVYDIFIKEKKAIKFITAFDFYFYNGYQTDKYINFLETCISMDNINELFQKGINDNSINLHGLDFELVFETIMNSFFALAQKKIYREKSYIEANREKHNGDLQVFLKLIFESIKN